MKLLLIMFFTINFAFGGLIKIKDGKVEPFTAMDYSLTSFVDEYARAMDVMIIYDKEKLAKSKVNLLTNNPLKLSDLKEYFSKALGVNNFSIIKEDGYYRIIKTRDIRYAPTELFESNNIPDTSDYVTVIHTMKYPIGRLVTRALRPFLSKYARVTNFSDRRTILIHEKGSQAITHINVVNESDNSESYERYLEMRKDSAVENSKKDSKDRKIEKLEKELSEIKSERRRKKRKKTKRVKKVKREGGLS